VQLLIPQFNETLARGCGQATVAGWTEAAICYTVFLSLTFQVGLVMNAIKVFLLEEEGAAAVEYGLLAALIATVLIVGVRAFSKDLCGVFTAVGAFLKNPSGAFQPQACA
jgi:pilus assembly protein Flp/PilA